MASFVLPCIYPKDSTLTVDGKSLLLKDAKGRETCFPFSSVQSIHFSAPTMTRRGSIDLDILKSPTSSLLGINLGNEPERFIFSKEHAQTAEQLYRFVLQELSAPATAPSTSANFVDELMKLKALLDVGALTQEEFEIAKKKLLS